MEKGRKQLGETKEGDATEVDDATKRMALKRRKARNEVETQAGKAASGWKDRMTGRAGNNVIASKLELGNTIPKLDEIEKGCEEAEKRWKRCCLMSTKSRNSKTFEVSRCKVWMGIWGFAASFLHSSDRFAR